MRANVGRPGRPSRLWRGVHWLAVLMAGVAVTFASLADASEWRNRGMYSSESSVSQHEGRRSTREVYRPRRTIRSTGRPPRGNKYPGRGPRYGNRPRGPRHPAYRPRHPDIPAAAIPAIIGIIGTIATQPDYSEPDYDSPPPRIVRRPPPRSNPPSPPPPLPPQRPVASAGAPPAGEQRLVPDEVVVQLPAGTSAQALAQLEARHQLTRLETQTFQLTGESMVRWRIPDQRSVTAVIVALEADAGVSAAQPNYLFALQQGAAALRKGDPAQYAIGKLKLPEAHTLASGDKVLVAVIDSGIDVGHPELAGMIAESFDALPGEPAHAHGTAIAGTIVARARLLGVAPGSRILAARAFGAKPATAQATTFNILKSIDWAASNGARVINMSFAGPRDPAITRQLAAAYRRNVVLIAAAGNAGPTSPPLYPAADRHVIAVAATDSRDKLFERSNRGSHITISAPGVDIIAPAPRGAYQITSGTSVAAAFISGLAALLIERSPGMTPDQIRRVLQTTARDLGPRGRDQEFGAGLADAYRAVKSVQPRAADAVTSSRR